VNRSYACLQMRLANSRAREPRRIGEALFSRGTLVLLFLVSWWCTSEARSQTGSSLVSAAGHCTPQADPAVEPLAGIAKLERIRCLLDSGQRALAILLLQQRVAEQPADREAAALLDEQLAAATTVPPHPQEAALSAWVSAELGHDSNVNRATSEKVIHIPLLNYRSLALPELLVEQRSGFVGVQAGAAIRKSFGPSWQASLQVQGGLRANSAATAYLPHNYALVARADHAWDTATLGAGVSASQQWLAKYRLLERRAFRLQAGWRPAADITVAGSAEWADNTYPMFESLRTRESSQEIRITHSPTNLHVSAYLGDEAATGTIKDLDRSFSGAGVGWRRQVTDNSVFTADLASGRSRYRQVSPLFVARRTDQQTELALALHVRFGQGWTATPKVVLEHNDSNLVLNGYRRSQYLVEVRKDF
jgi:hypothetical protein